MAVKKEVPQYVRHLLERREKLAWDLIGINTKLDKYCDRIGIEDTNEACLTSHIMIYCEPQNAHRVTLAAIEKQLNAPKEAD